MSTTTANYSFIKPDPSEASGPEEVAENMIKTERVLINLELGSSTGRQNIAVTANYRNVSDAAVSINTQGAFENLTWSMTTDSAAWTDLYDLDNNWTTPSLGLIAAYTNGSYETYYEGYCCMD